jgi:hypothetical protein
MAATLGVYVYTGANAATESASAQTGADLISADNPTYSLANRQANPITVGSRSYEKWLKLKITAKPDNAVSNFLVWGDGSVHTSSTLVVRGNYTTGTTPTNATSSVATQSFTTYTSGNKLTWDAGPITNTNDTTKFLIFQLQVAADAGPGNWTQEAVSYSYDEI